MNKSCWGESDDYVNERFEIFKTDYKWLTFSYVVLSPTDPIM